MTVPPRLSARALRLQARQRLYDMFQSQLDIARHQAEGWRNFLATATALLAAVLVLKGRENVAELTPGYRWGVVLAMALGLLALLASAFAAASAAHGRPKDALRHADEARLLRWEEKECERIGGLVNRARWLAVAGVLATAAGVMATWVAPASEKGAASVSVHTRQGTVCGELVALDPSGVTVRVKASGGTASGKGPKDSLRKLTWGSQALSAGPVSGC
ncbi:hypothetical protein [Streptomyces djakartensis]|uniref:Uncharacterized protein n=1 Tax=Streptomyces djakartensis TaxID=68193 RepID=A0ABQ2Z6D7_9ACTN|nr:hypothetical protein [Streptomyces djakartensis]GGY04966.1 hypothetical protein GCM10010384_06570 [Streptomyces djakartensis]